jgi:hypothetical protein
VQATDASRKGEDHDSGGRGPLHSKKATARRYWRNSTRKPRSHCRNTMPFSEGFDAGSTEVASCVPDRAAWPSARRRNSLRSFRPAIRKRRSTQVSRPALHNRARPIELTDEEAMASVGSPLTSAAPSLPSPGYAAPPCPRVVVPATTSTAFLAGACNRACATSMPRRTRTSQRRSRLSPMILELADDDEVHDFPQAQETERSRDRR